MFAHVRVCNVEGASHMDNRLEMVVFTSKGDIRNALNNLQSTNAGFGSVCALNIYMVCDAPYPTSTR